VLRGVVRRWDVQGAVLLELRRTRPGASLQERPDGHQTFEDAAAGYRVSPVRSQLALRPQGAAVPEARVAKEQALAGLRTALKLQASPQLDEAREQ
jgi:hypothetical protein